MKKVNLATKPEHLIFLAIETNNFSMFLRATSDDSWLTVRNKRGNTPLIEAVKRNNFQFYIHLTRGGADINEVGENGTTALIESVKLNDDQLFICLTLANNIDTKHTDDFGKDALRYAEEKDDLFMIGVLE